MFRTDYSIVTYISTRFLRFLGIGLRPAGAFVLPSIIRSQALRPSQVAGSGQIRALVIEDEETLSGSIRLLLELAGYAVDTALTAREGERLAGETDYGVIILDLGLPDNPGMAVLRTIRDKSQRTPVLIASGAADIAATIAALEAGADDYLPKPFRADELVARVRALVRRDSLLDAETPSCGNVLLHRLDRLGSVAGVSLQLTTKEFAVLEYFIAHKNLPVTREDLLKVVWHCDFDTGTNIVDVNVSRLRAKLVELGASCRFESVRGIGYVFNDGSGGCSTGPG